MRALQYTGEATLNGLNAFLTGTIDEYAIWHDIRRDFDNVVNNQNGSILDFIALTENQFFLYLSIFNSNTELYWEFATT